MQILPGSFLFSEKTKYILKFLSNVAYQNNFEVVTFEMMLYALCKFDESIKEFLFLVGIELQYNDFCEAFKEKNTFGNNVKFCYSIIEVLEHAVFMANDEVIEPINVFMAIIVYMQRRKNNECALNELDYNYVSAYFRTHHLVKETSADIFVNERQKPYVEEMKKYAVDLTEKAEKGLLGAVFEREKEIDQIIRILLRRNKNNPCLIGFPGVGKTAVVEGLANLIVESKVPSSLLSTRIYSLNIASIIAGAKYRGEFEERLNAVIDTARKNPEIILFIDELHTIIGTGSVEGSLDAANILKPYLSRGEIKIIGATTNEEYMKYINNDKALERRFQPIFVEEPDEITSCKIINGIIDKYATFHGVSYTDDAIKQAILLTAKLQPYRKLPDKAIDLLDEASVFLKLNNYNYSKTVDVNTINELVKEKFGESIATEQTPEITIEKLKKQLFSNIFGQEKALNDILLYLKMHFIKKVNTSKPCSLFFCGPTGVGKTMTAKIIAENLYGRDSIVVFNMTEYKEKHSLARLIGSPPGYIGYDEGGDLFKKISNKIGGVIVFDEIEKAHSDIYDLFLQMTDEGVLTDGKGNTVDLKNFVIIMTSNIGFSREEAKSACFGFENDTEIERDMEVKKQLMQNMKKYFSSELIGRIGCITSFNKLSKSAYCEIIKMQNDLLIANYKKEGVEVTFSSSVYEYILNDFKTDFGVRGLLAYYSTKLNERLLKFIDSYPSKIENIAISIENSEIIFTVNTCFL